MGTIGEKFSRGIKAVKEIAGVSLPPESVPKEGSFIIREFFGMNLAVSPEGMDPRYAQLMVDIEPTKDGGITPRLSHTLSYNTGLSDLSWNFQHGSIDYDSETVFIVPPNMVVWPGPGSLTTAHAVGLPATGAYGWDGISILGDLIFSNGETHTFLRAFGAAVVTDISADIIARTFGAAFGRVFAGGIDLGTGYQALAIAWNAADGDPANWTGPGSGAEFLISNSGRTDEILKVLPLGNDQLCIVCRNSIWVGMPTGDPYRPANFVERIQRKGGRSKRAITATPYGVAILTDEGVMLFDGNSLTNISSEILPQLGVTEVLIDEYYMVYREDLDRLRLQTINEVWIYQFPRQGQPGKWWREGQKEDSVIIFDKPSVSANERVVYTRAGIIYSESAPVNIAVEFSSALAPLESITDEVEIHGVEIEYSSFIDEIITLFIPDGVGGWKPYTIFELPSSGGVKRKIIHHEVATTRGIGVRLYETLSSITIYRIRLIVQHAGPGFDDA